MWWWLEVFSSWAPVVVVRIGTSTIADPNGAHIGPQARLHPANGTASPSYFRPIQRPRTQAPQPPHESRTPVRHPASGSGGLETPARDTSTGGASDGGAKE
ncbi:hypothetical protein GCM10022235_17640 [Kribbella ginsengisoli]|uniref:Secreted protein n=1 Tax=Kribbella ginsengisoli TaxID=363865 RepID=A0ABP6WGN9_9ACTN